MKSSVGFYEYPEQPLTPSKGKLRLRTKVLYTVGVFIAGIVLSAYPEFVVRLALALAQVWIVTEIWEKKR